MKHVLLTTIGVVSALACYPTTTRPHIVPQPGSAVMELELFLPEATREVALALDADSIPVRRTEPKDGWLESEWFDVATLRPTSRRPLGPDIVKVRAFIEPSKANHSLVTIETVYRPVADPSRDGRSLERQVPIQHPISIRVAGIVNRLTLAHGEPLEAADSVAIPPSVATDTTPAKP